MSVPKVTITGAQDLRDMTTMGRLAVEFSARHTDSKHGHEVSWVITFSSAYQTDTHDRLYSAWWTKARAVSIRRDS